MKTTKITQIKYVQPKEYQANTQAVTAVTAVTAASVTKNITAWLSKQPEILQEEMSVLNKKWEQRAAAFRLCTLDYQRTQQRMLPLLLEDPKLTSTTFNKVTEHCRYATKATYWIALLAAATACGRATPVDAKSMKKFLEGRTWAEEPTLKEAADHDMIERTANVLPPIMQDAVRLSFVLGQRLSDVLKMQRKSLSIFQQHLSLTFYAGKVIQKIGPYSINLAATLEPIRSIVDRALARTTSNEDHIFVSYGAPFSFFSFPTFPNPQKRTA